MMSHNNPQYAINGNTQYNTYNEPHYESDPYDPNQMNINKFSNLNINAATNISNYPLHMPPPVSQQQQQQQQYSQYNAQQQMMNQPTQSLGYSTGLAQNYTNMPFQSQPIQDPNNMRSGTNVQPLQSNLNPAQYEYFPNAGSYQSIPNQQQSQQLPNSFPPVHPPNMPLPLPPSQQQPNINNPPPLPQSQLPNQTGSRYGSQTQSLNPEYMPSAVQVIELDKSNNNTPYPTGTRDRVPPLVTTDFIAIDQGTCNPKYIRSSIYAVPAAPDMLKSLNIPFVLNICPFAKLDEAEQRIVCGEMNPKGPIRCIRCKAYMSPLMTFIDGGRRFQCNICGGNTEVSEENFAHLDQSGRRIDCFNRPELCLGSYELMATAEYCKNDTLPNPPAFLFMLDVSYNSVKSGLLNLFCNNLKDHILPYLATDELVPNSPKPLVGFVTYDRVLHFYNLQPNMSKPQMLVISYLDNDTGSDLVPLVNGFLVDPDEAIEQISTLMENIIENFTDTEERNVILGPVIESGMEALKAAGGRAGKLFIFHSSLPVVEAPGKLKARDERTILGTDKEKTLFSSGSSYYSKLAESCSESGVSIDLFLTPSAFIDVATLSDLPKFTGGNLYKYDFFSPSNHGTKFLKDIQHAVSSPFAFDAVMRVRTSLGTRTVDFLGNFYMKNTEDVNLACVSSDKSVIVEIKHNDKLQENESVNIQVAVLYTSISGQRRLRIHNISFNVSTNILDIFKLTDLDTLMNWMSRNAVKTFQAKSVKEVRDEISQKSSQILASYRRNYAEQSKPAELVLPENLKLLPLYANSLLKCDFMQSDNSYVSEQTKDSGTDLATDERAYQCFLLNDMDVKHTQVFLYPRLLPLINAKTEFSPESKHLPSAIRDSYVNLSSEGAYLIENGICIILWIGQNANREWLQNVFDCSSPSEIINRYSLPIHKNNDSLEVNRIVQIIRSTRSRYMMLNIVIQGDRTESAFKKLLVEDRGERGNSSYVDFLCHIHKEIRSILNY